jgi:hypothetical protein
MSVPFNSGCDNEEEPCDIQFAIEEMHEKYTSFLETKDSDKQNAASNKKKEMAAAEIIQCASLGMNPSEEEVEECGFGNKKKKARVSTDGTGGTGGTGGSGITSSLQESIHLSHLGHLCIPDCFFRSSSRTLEATKKEL